MTNVSGQFERQQFATLSPADDAAVATLKRAVTNEILPAAEKQDFQSFASSLHRYNRESGQLFASVQGGPYHGAAVANLVQSLIRLGAQGVGQSSWGPGVFAWFRSRTEADDFAAQAPGADMTLIAIAHPCNQPREVR